MRATVGVICMEGRELGGDVGCCDGGWVWWGKALEVREIACFVAWEGRDLVRNESVI